MATYRFSVKLISRSSGRCAPAAAAYRAGQRITNERTGEIFDYRRRSDVLESTILAPPLSPHWVYDRAALWNAVEATERRKDAQVAREVQVSLPHELSREQNVAMLRTFVQKQFVDQGMVADMAVHSAHRGSDERNVHAHILLSTRTVSPTGFGAKVRAWNERTLLSTWRLEWERHVNSALELAGSAARVDHRSYVERGLDIEPEPKQGPVATKLERMGVRSRAGDDRCNARKRNSERARLREQSSAIDRELAEDLAAARKHPTDAMMMAPGRLSRSVRMREAVLSDEYFQNMDGSRLARYWRIQRTAMGLTFENAHGKLVDKGDRVVAKHGSAFEIEGMLDLAMVKGWDSVAFSGDDAFKSQAMSAALDRGLSIEPSSADVHLLQRVIEQRRVTHVAANRTPQTKNLSKLRTRSH